MVRVSFRERQWVVRQEAIVEAAKELLVQGGYHAMSMDAVSEQVGISKATLYQHFVSKEDLAAAVILQHIDRFVGWIEEEHTSGRTPTQRLRRLIRQMVFERYSRGAPGIGENYSRPEVMARLLARAEFCSGFTRMVQLIEADVRAAQEAGDIDSALPPSLAVKMLFGLVHGMKYNALPDSGPIDIDLLAFWLERAFLSGLAPEKQNEQLGGESGLQQEPDNYPPKLPRTM